MVVVAGVGQLVLVGLQVEALDRRADPVEVDHAGRDRLESANRQVEHSLGFFI